MKTIYISSTIIIAIIFIIIVIMNNNDSGPSNLNIDDIKALVIERLDSKNIIELKFMSTLLSNQPEMSSLEFKTITLELNSDITLANIDFTNYLYGQPRSFNRAYFVHEIYLFQDLNAFNITQFEIEKNQVADSLYNNNSYVIDHNVPFYKTIYGFFLPFEFIDYFLNVYYTYVNAYFWILDGIAAYFFPKREWSFPRIYHFEDGRMFEFIARDYAEIFLFPLEIFFEPRKIRSFFLYFFSPATTTSINTFIPVPYNIEQEDFFTQLLDESYERPCRREPLSNPQRGYEIRTSLDPNITFEQRLWIAFSFCEYHQIKESYSTLRTYNSFIFYKKFIPYRYINTYDEDGNLVFMPFYLLEERRFRKYLEIVPFTLSQEMRNYANLTKYKIIKSRFHSKETIQYTFYLDNYRFFRTKDEYLKQDLGFFAYVNHTKGNTLEKVLRSLDYANITYCKAMNNICSEVIFNKPSVIIKKITITIHLYSKPNLKQVIEHVKVVYLKKRYTI